MKAVLCGQANVGAEFCAEGRQECPCLFPVTDEKQQMEIACEGAGLVVPEQISREPQKRAEGFTLAPPVRHFCPVLYTAPSPFSPARRTV